MRYLRGLGIHAITWVGGTILTIFLNTGEYISFGGKRIYFFTTALTANVTATAAPVGSYAVTIHATGASIIFVSDASKWQAFAAVTQMAAAAHVAALTDNSGGAVANGTIEAVTNQEAGYVYYQNIPAATTTGAATQLSLNGVADGTPMLSPVSPKIPRNLVYTITDGNAGISAFSITAVGVGVDGSAVSENITFAGGLVQQGSKIFASLTSVTVDSVVGEGAGDLLDVGYGVKIGVPLPAGATSFSIVKLVSAGTAEAASATDTTNNSFTSTTAPDGAKDFEIWYEYAHPAITALMAAVKELSTKQNETVASLQAGGYLAAS